MRECVSARVDVSFAVVRESNGVDPSTVRPLRQATSTGSAQVRTGRLTTGKAQGRRVLECRLC